ncbi:hypothetical protein [Micromonospora profundi]|uniref:hypothetical protein n=1 Tax=Micromonospora profundi TaxID=1420889 RepID=UPI003811CC0C
MTHDGQRTTSTVRSAIVRIATRYAGLLAAAVVLAALAVATVSGMRSAPDVDRSSGPDPATVLLPADLPPLRLLPRQPEPVVREPEADPDERCEEALRAWVNENDNTVVVRVQQCRSFEWAAYQQALVLDDGRRIHADLTAADIPFGVEMVTRQAVDDVPASAVVVVARRGNYVLQTTTLSDEAHLAEDVAVNRAVAQQQWSRLVGQPGTGVHPPVSGTLLARTGQTLALLLLGLYAATNLVGWARNAARGTRAVSGTPVDSPRVRWHDVSGRSARLAAAARGRFWLIVLLMAASQALPLPTPAKAALLGVAPLFYSLGRRHTPGERELWGRHAPSQVRTERNRATAMAWFVLSGALLVLGLLSLLAPAMLLQVGSTEEVGPGGRWHPTVMADGPHGWRLVPVHLLVADLLAVSVILLWASGFLYRLARRRSALDAPRKLEADTRAPIIFLRNFSDDEGTIRTSPMTRKAAVDKLGLIQFERFEEILVRYLSVYGPVIAVNNPNSRRAPLGAARESLAHDDWQKAIGERIDSCTMIVVAAAPEADTPGLRWELEQIVERGALARTVLVVPPYPASQVVPRWRRFLTMGTRFDVPDSTTEYADRILLLTNGHDGVWDSYHGRQRTDWAYAVALAAAAEGVIARSSGQPPGGGRDGAEQVDIADREV